MLDSYAAGQHKRVRQARFLRARAAFKVMLAAAAGEGRRRNWGRPRFLCQSLCSPPSFLLCRLLLRRLARFLVGGMR